MLARESTGLTDTPPNVAGIGGMYSGLGLFAQYQSASDGGGLVLGWVNSELRYYSSLSGTTSAYNQAGATFRVPITRRVRVQVSPYAAYVPNYSLQFLPDFAALETEPVLQEPLAVGAPAVDFAVIPINSVRYGGNASATYKLTSASNISVRYGYGNFENRQIDMEIQTSGVAYSQRFSRNALFKLGYVRQNVDRFDSARELLDQDESGLIENVNIGLDYLKPISRTRRTFVGFSTGSVIGEDLSGNRRVQATGTASLVHQMGRTWNVRVEYFRGLRYLEGFYRPAFADAASVSFLGLASRRLEVSADLSYLDGIVGFDPDSGRFDSYGASGRLRIAISRTLAAFVGGSFYHYRFEDAVVRPRGIPATYDRLSARVGMSLFIPMIE
jgi:hypothetical protein